MSSSLPTRPNLDHLREQAKDLLASYRAGDAHAVTTFREFLPAMASRAETHLNLSDAQSAIARKHGFPSWTKLVKHVEILRNLEGTWQFNSLEVDGAAYPEAAYRRSQITLEGDRFTMSSPEGTYEGIFTIDVDRTPATIDIDFTEGPEKGNRSVGIFEFDGRDLKICLGLTGVARPVEFATRLGSGHALETFRRGSASNPEPDPKCETFAATAEMLAGFGEVTPEMEALQGEWAIVSIKRDGMLLPNHHFGTGRRSVHGAECTVTFEGQVFFKATMKVDVDHEPVWIDYLLTDGPSTGQLQLGILDWQNALLRLCFAEPGASRPVDFKAETGSGHTTSVWRRSSAE